MVRTAALALTIMARPTNRPTAMVGCRTDRPHYRSVTPSVWTRHSLGLGQANHLTLFLFVFIFKKILCGLVQSINRGKVSNVLD